MVEVWGVALFFAFFWFLCWSRDRQIKKDQSSSPSVKDVHPVECLEHDWEVVEAPFREIIRGCSGYWEIIDPLEHNKFEQTGEKRIVRDNSINGPRDFYSIPAIKVCLKCHTVEDEIWGAINAIQRDWDWEDKVQIQRENEGRERHERARLAQEIYLKSKEG